MIWFLSCGMSSGPKQTPCRGTEFARPKRIRHLSAARINPSCDSQWRTSMTRFAVWAPTKELMEVVVDGEVIRLSAHPNGWWSADAPDSGPGSDYLFRIDGGDARPDPRSNFQPQ